MTGNFKEVSFLPSGWWNGPVALLWDQKTQVLFCPYRLSPAASKPSKTGEPHAYHQDTEGCLAL